jgi:hypothetical protein
MPYSQAAINLKSKCPERSLLADCRDVKIGTRVDPGATLPSRSKACGSVAVLW